MRAGAVGLIALVAACGRLDFEPLPDAMPPVACERSGYPDVPWLLDGHFGLGAGLHVVDLDGDGMLDLISTDAMPDELVVHLGHGDGTFGARRTYAASQTILRHLVIEDLDDDGNLDAAALGYNSTTISLWFGRGDGTFTAETTVSTSIASGMIALDLDQDRLPELLVAEGGGVTVHRNLGGRMFAGGVELALPAPQRAIGRGNLDGDGMDDVISVSDTGHAVWIFHRGSDGGLTTPVSIATDPSFNFVIVEAADVDRDGLDDILLGDLGNEVAVLRNQGGDVFVAQPYATVGDVEFDFAVADVTRDGWPDVLVADQGEDIVSFLVNRGDGTFDLAPDLHAGSQTTSLALADVDRDGRVDLLATAINGTTITLGRGESFDQPVPYSAPSMTFHTGVTDIDADGRTDLLVTSTSGAALWYGRGDGTFDTASLPGATFYFDPAPEMIDLDGDGDLDIVGIAATGTDVAVVLQTGTRTFAAPVMYSSGVTLRSLAVGDLDRDTRPEVVAGQLNAGTLFVFPNVGGGALGTPSQLSLASEPTSLVYLDFKGDGSGDIAMCSQQAQTFVLLLGNGDRTFQPPGTLALPGMAFSLLAGDVDRNGRTDVVVQMPGQIMTVLNNGSGAVNLSPVSPVDSFIDASMLAPIGPYPSLVGANDSTNSIDILDGRGDGTFAPGRHYNAGEYPKDAHAADLDGKNGLDFVVGGYAHVSVVLDDACP